MNVAEIGKLIGEAISKKPENIFENRIPATKNKIHERYINTPNKKTTQDHYNPA